MAMRAAGLGPENDYAGEDQQLLEGVPHQQTRNCLTVIKIWSRATDWAFTPRQTGRLTVGRNINSTDASFVEEEAPFRNTYISRRK
jgi:hypothetical protein